MAQQTCNKLEQIHIGKKGAAPIAAPGWTGKAADRVKNLCFRKHFGDAHWIGLGKCPPQLPRPASAAALFDLPLTKVLSGAPARSGPAFARQRLRQYVGQAMDKIQFRRTRPDCQRPGAARAGLQLLARVRQKELRRRCPPQLPRPASAALPAQVFQEHLLDQGLHLPGSGYANTPAARAPISKTRRCKSGTSTSRSSSRRKSCSTAGISISRC